MTHCSEVEGEREVPHGDGVGRGEDGQGARVDRLAHVLPGPQVGGVSGQSVMTWRVPCLRTFTTPLMRLYR